MDKRSETRVPHNVRFFVHVHECEDDPDMVGVSVACEAIDFSPHGLQLKTDEALSSGTRLNVTIGIGEPFTMYLLRGEVRWRRPMDEDLFATGLKLHDAEGTDYAAWQASFDEIFTASP